MESQMTIQEFLVKSRKPRPMGLEIRPRIVCNDGFSMSVQASQGAYCEPREDTGDYISCEIGYPSEKEYMIMMFAEDRNTPTATVYARVPVELIDLVITKHGGINIERTFK